MSFIYAKSRKSYLLTSLNQLLLWHYLILVKRTASYSNSKPIVFNIKSKIFLNKGCTKNYFFTLSRLSSKAKYTPFFLVEILTWMPIKAHWGFLIPLKFDSNYWKRFKKWHSWDCWRSILLETNFNFISFSWALTVELVGRTKPIKMNIEW